MKRTTRTFLTLLSVAALSWSAPPAHASTPDWAKPALSYLTQHDYLSGKDFAAHQPMRRADFKTLMHKAFGGNYHRVRGKVRAAEVSAALVRALAQAGIANHLDSLSSPDGWTPALGAHFGTEVVARESGLRHDWPVSEERYEASSGDHMKQADIAYAVWQAKTSPDLYSAEALTNFNLPNYGGPRRRVVNFALSMVGKPYVYGGEWAVRSPSGYLYGAQAHGGFDCSGFAWYVLKRKSSSYSPLQRPYKGWWLGQRSAAQMAGATQRKIRYSKLRPADVVFFSSQGRSAPASSVYHAGIYLGHGWMIHSSGSRDGVSLSGIGRNSWWHSQIAWGRRVIHS